jgi:hypothetical protein
MDHNEGARAMPSESAQDEILASILQKLGGTQGGVNTGTAANSFSGGMGTGGANPIGDIFSSVLSNPELIAKLPVIISSVKPIIEILGKGGAPSSSASESGAVAVGSSASSGAAASVKDIHVSAKGTDSRTALLCAMKPYLSEDRRNAVDYIVKLSRLGEILKTL